MISRILIKLLDQAVLPAVALLSGRIVSVVLLAQYMKVPFTIDATGFVFANPEDFIKINSLSTAFLILITALGILYVLIKAYLFQESHIRPGTTAKMYSLNMEYFIQSSFDLYTQGAVWLSYMYLLTISAGFFAIMGMMLPWVFSIAIVVTLAASVLFALDIEHELSISKTKSEIYDEDETYIEMETFK